MRNLTIPFAPSVDDLFLLPQRVSQRAKAFAYHYGLDDLFGRIRGPGSIIAEPTITEALNSSSVNTTKSFVQAAAATPSVPPQAAAGAPGLFTWQSWKTAGGIFTYVSSRWAIVTLLMVCIIRQLTRSLTNAHFTAFPLQSDPILRLAQSPPPSQMASPTWRICASYYIYPLSNTVAPTRHTMPVVSQLAAAAIWQSREEVLAGLCRRRRLSV